MLPATKFLADCWLLAECLLLGARGAVPGAAWPRAQPRAAQHPVSVVCQENEDKIHPTPTAEDANWDSVGK